MRHSLFMTAAAAALATGLGQASAGPLAAGPTNLSTPGTIEVQYWGGWGPPRVYDYDDEPPVYRRRYVVPDYDDVLPASEAVAIARSMGYRAISRPRLAGRVWIVETVGAAGQRARVTIHAYSGAPINIREFEPGGQRVPAPPALSDERPRFGDTPPARREGRLGPDGLERPDRPARPAPNITARIVPVPTPRPDIDGDLTPRPQVAPPVPPVAQPPAAETPAAPPPAASLPRRVDPPATPPSPLSVQPSQPFTPPAVTPPQAEQPSPEPPTAALPPRAEPPAPVQPTPQVEPAPPAVAAPTEPAPAAALPQATPDPAPAAPTAPAADPSAVPAEPPRSESAPATETAQKPGDSDGVLIDGRFLGPNGEQLPPAGGPAATPSIRQVTPPPSN